MDSTLIAFPGARPPDRRRTVDAFGIELAVYEWGEPSAPPLLLVHGGFDFARTYDVFAPLLADAGYRVVSWDHRGHGDSKHAELYSWPADERDMLAVMDSIGHAPLPAIGHSKGGSMLVGFIPSNPHRFTHYVAIDGLPFRSPPPDVAERERTVMAREEMVGWLEHRRRAHALIRKPGTLDELAKRRARMNPRLSQEWLRYLVTVGARHDADGYRWKIDPSLRMGGFGPWRSRWLTERLPGFPVPMLAIFGTESEPMGWGVTPDNLRPYLPPRARLEVMKETGHFIHIERPHETAAMVLDFLRAPSSTPSSPQWA
jgi:pimeloyl-ACP methyl ester carboxylesterase